MKKIVSSVSAFALAFSLFGAPAAAFANADDAGIGTQGAVVDVQGGALPEGTTGPVKKEDVDASASEQPEAPKEPVYNDEAETAPDAPAQQPEEQPSFIDAIIGFFTGGNGGEEAKNAADESAPVEEEVSIDKSRAVDAASVEVTLRTAYPEAMDALDAAGDALTLSVNGASSAFASAGAGGTVRSATIAGIAPGTHSVTLSGAKHLPLTFDLECKAGMKHSFTIVDSAARADDDADAAFLPYGDFSGNSTLDDEDTRLLSEAYVQGSEDVLYDLTGDGMVTLKDVQALTAVKGSTSRAPQNVTELPDTSQTDPEVPEGTSILLDGKVVTGTDAEAALRLLLENRGRTVGFTASANTVPGATKVPVSEDLPVTLSLNANGVLMDRITLYAPLEGGAGASMATEGTLTMAFEKDGEDRQLTIPIPCDRAFEAPDHTVLPYVTAKVDRAAGYIHVDLGENVKMYDLEFTFTEASGPDDTLVQLTRIRYEATNGTGPDGPGPDEPGPDEPDPTPLPTTPEGLAITKTDDRLIEAEWDAAYNNVAYEVELSREGADPEIISTIQPRIQVTTFGGQPLENGTTYTLRVRSVSEDNAKSDWGPAVTATPQLKTPPANPAGLALTAGYQEITATWNAVDRADHYVVRWSEVGGTVSGQRETTGTQFTVRPLPNETEFAITVVAVNEFGSSEETGTPETLTARTTYVTTKVPWYGLINRAVQDAKANPPENVFSSVTLGGSEEAGRAMVDGDYNTAVELPTDALPSFSAGAKATFRQSHNIRDLALSTNLGTGYAEGIEDVQVRVVSGVRTTTTYTKDSGLTWGSAPLRDGSTEVATNTIMVTLPTMVRNASQVEVFFTRADGASVTISELAFYDAATFQEEVENLFVPGSFKTELNSSVTADTIRSLRELLSTPDTDTNTPPNETAELYWRADDLLAELDLAEALLGQEVSSPVTANPDINSAAGTRTGMNAWQPLGVVAAAGAKVQVNVTPVGDADGATVGDATKLRLVHVQQHGSETEWASLGYLKLGINAFTIPQLSHGIERGGGLYVEYEDADCPAYQVKAVGGQEVPMLDISSAVSEGQIRQACASYESQLQGHVNALRQKHADGAHTGAYDEALCISNATEVITPSAVISMPATLMLENLGTGSLAQGLPLTDKMLRLLYQQAGLFDVDDQANAGAVAAYGQNNALPPARMNFRYQRADLGTGGAQAMNNFLALEWDQLKGMGTAPTLRTDASGKRTYGALYGWDVSLAAAKALVPTDASLPQVFASFGAQLVTASDTNASSVDGGPGLRFSYGKVNAHLDNSTTCKLDSMPDDLGTAVLWQLHLAYDDGFSYTEFANADELMEGSIFARMNAYVRNPQLAPAGLDLNGVGADDAFMRLACAASGKNLLPFFEKWGLVPSNVTRLYARSFPEESRSIWLITDESRNGALSTAQADVPQVAATVQAAGPNEAGEVEITGIQLKEGVRANLGVEVLRQVGTDGSTREVVGFVPAGQTTFTDRLTSDNGQTLTYFARAVDTSLAVSDVTPAGEVQASFPRNLNKAYWTVESTMESDDDPSTIVDGSVGTAYAGTLDREAAGALGGAAMDGNAYPSVTIAFGKATDACGIRYFPGADVQNAFKRLWVQVSNDGVNWTSAGYKEVGEATFAASKCATVYFTESMVMPSAHGSDGAQISVQNVRYLRVTDLDGSDGPRSVAEIDVIGSLPDAISFQKDDEGALTGVGVADEDVRVEAGAQGVQPGAATVIPAGSLVISGVFTGDPAKSTLMLRDALGEEISQDAHQVIVADAGQGGDISYSASGTWVMYFEPGTWEDVVDEWSFVSAQLYRSGTVLTASCSSERLPVSAA